MSCDPGSQLKHVVLDSAVFLSGTTISLLQKFFSIGAELVTIHEVLNEIRDGAARARLESLPFRIETREPSADAMAAVARFSRETGDLSVLSITDLKVLALTYELELQHHGTERIRQHPKSSRSILPNGRPQRSVKLNNNNSKTSIDNVIEQLDQVDLKDEDQHSKLDSPSTLEDNSAGQKQDVETDPELKESSRISEDVINGVEEALQNSESVAREFEQDSASLEGVVCDDEVSEGSEDDGDTEQISVDNDHEVDNVAANDSDDGEWITVQNLHNRHRSGPGRPRTHQKPSIPLSSSSTVTCITTDFAMQNVLVQMGLRLTALDGRSITSLAQWVLRCCACMKITLELERIFCPSCAGQTLTRSRVKVTSGGWIKYKHTRPKPANLRGTIYSIPKPKGGRNNTDLILREDQLLKMMPKTKKKSSEDLFEDASEFAWRKTGASLRQQVGHPRGKCVNEPIKKTAKRKHRR